MRKALERNADIIIGKMKSFILEKNINDLEIYNEVKEQVKFFYYNHVEGVNKQEEIELVNKLKNINRTSDLSFFSSVLLMTFFNDNFTTHNNTPPLEAYEYIGNNKLEIKHSDRSYGLLFE